MMRTPVQISLRDAKAMNYTNVRQVKMLDCAFYNACLNDAMRADWAGFGCASCKAFEALDVEQRVQDTIGLFAARTAAKNYEKTGTAGRVRGVRPGADAKIGNRKLRVLRDDEIPDESEAEEAAA